MRLVLTQTNYLSETNNASVLCVFQTHQVLKFLGRFMCFIFRIYLYALFAWDKFIWDALFAFLCFYGQRPFWFNLFYIYTTKTMFVNRFLPYKSFTVSCKQPIMKFGNIRRNTTKSSFNAWARQLFEAERWPHGTFRHVIFIMMRFSIQRVQYC